ncbi:hypothetical protein IF1G_00648 [Cordyceps javanica]|uniref:Uncharacterized protein n=1 Tax=Cordyceps javanica TaxID=43265 RepID=A0A545VG67_9HYPO|nr:hypothetical protein IF1G_00648 [Cordyceps javanica]
MAIIRDGTETWVAWEAFFSRRAPGEALITRKSPLITWAVHCCGGHHLARGPSSRSGPQRASWLGKDVRHWTLASWEREEDLHQPKFPAGAAGHACKGASRGGERRDERHENRRDVCGVDGGLHMGGFRGRLV